MGTAVRWTEEEVNTLKQLAEEYSMSEVADKLHRPQTSVRVKARQLGITFCANTNLWTSDQEQCLKDLWGIKSVQQIADLVKKSKASVYSKAKFFSLPNSVYVKPSQVKSGKVPRTCYSCKNVNDRPPPSTKCSNCFKGKPEPKGTGWSSRRCKNCDEGYKGKTRDFCERSCKTEYLTKCRMLTLGFSDSLKTCKKCLQDKIIWKFNLDSSRKDKVHPYCRDCQKDGKALAAVNARNRRLLGFYGITLVEYDQLLASQGGHCAMCMAVPSPEKNLAVDHDHVSGAVRGLLCLTCNKYKLGQLTIEDVDRIYVYLHNPPADQFFGTRRFVPNGMEKPKKRRRGKSK